MQPNINNEATQQAFADLPDVVNMYTHISTTDKQLLPNLLTE